MFGLIRSLIPLKNTNGIQMAQSFFHSLINTPTSELLRPAFVNFNVPNCGMKMKGRLRRRCKDCYFVRRQERLYVICETHPRHKQMSMQKREKNTWILTHATQSKQRAY